MIRDGQDGQLELRDPSLLKLFFGGIAPRADIVALARAELAQHEQQLTTCKCSLSVRYDAPHQAFAGQQCCCD